MSGKCKVDISRVELTRLIDNNLSNAIKYSSQNSTIVVVLSENRLSFSNLGKPIENHKTIFDKYVRENSVIGGHGLGLSIVKEIAKNNFISINLTSTLDGGGTKFLYIFKCHTNDTSVS
jgi:signal transduction histidine kinase